MNQRLFVLVIFFGRHLPAAGRFVSGRRNNATNPHPVGRQQQYLLPRSAESLRRLARQIL